MPQKNALKHGNRNNIIWKNPPLPESFQENPIFLKFFLQKPFIKKHVQIGTINNE